MSWLSNLFRRRKTVVDPVNNEITMPGLKFALKLPKLPGATITTHTELSFDVPCVLRPPSHKLRIFIVDKVVKAIVSPCSRDEALASSALSEDGCGGPYTGVIDRLRGSTRWGRFSETDDKVLNEAYRHAATVRSEREAARLYYNESFRVSPSLWPAFIKQKTGLNSEPIVATIAGRVSANLVVETPLAPSNYRFDGGTWGLAGGPGDKRVYDLLSKHIKLNGFLVRYVGARREPFWPSINAATAWPHHLLPGEDEDEDS